MTREKIRNYVAAALSQLNNGDVTLAAMTLAECAAHMDVDAEEFTRHEFVRCDNISGGLGCRLRQGHDSPCRWRQFKKRG